MRRAATPVLILEMDHRGAVGAVRSLGRWGVPAYGVDGDARAAALCSRYAQGGFVWDLATQPPDASVEFLLATAGELGARPVLLATDDATALFVAQYAAKLKTKFLFPDNSFELVRALYNKRQMDRLAGAAGVPTAKTVFPQSRSDVMKFVQTATYPLMLKAVDKIAMARRTNKVMRIIRSADELLTYYDAVEDPANPTLMFQEYIPGRDETVWMFNGYFDEQSNCLFGLTGRKIRQWHPYMGVTTLGVCLPNSTVEALTFQLVKATGYAGILDIGYRYDVRDNTYKLLDVNPRLGATFRLFVGTGDLDVVRAAYLHLTGQAVPSSRMCEGRKWVVEGSDLASSWRCWRDGVLTVRDWLTGYRGVQEAAWFARDDLSPFLHMCGKLFTRELRQILKRLSVRRMADRGPWRRKRANAKRHVASQPAIGGDR